MSRSLFQAIIFTLYKLLKSCFIWQLCYRHSASFGNPAASSVNRNPFTTGR
jgi:hypothetical protein